MPDQEQTRQIGVAGDGSIDFAGEDPTLPTGGKTRRALLRTALAIAAGAIGAGATKAIEGLQINHENRESTPGLTEYQSRNQRANVILLLSSITDNTQALFPIVNGIISSPQGEKYDDQLYGIALKHGSESPMEQLALVASVIKENLSPESSAQVKAAMYCLALQYLPWTPTRVPDGKYDHKPYKSLMAYIDILLDLLDPIANDNSFTSSGEPDTQHPPVATSAASTYPQEIRNLVQTFVNIKGIQLPSNGQSDRLNLFNALFEKAADLS